MGIIKQFYDYKGRLCIVKNVFHAEVKGYPKMYVAAVFLHDGTCFVAEWSSLKAKPHCTNERDWELEHEPIEYFGSSVASILAREGYSKMEDVARLDGKELKAIKGIGDTSVAIIAMGLKEWKDVSTHGQLFDRRLGYATD